MAKYLLSGVIILHRVVVYIRISTNFHYVISNYLPEKDLHFYFITIINKSFINKKRRELALYISLRIISFLKTYIFLFTEDIKLDFLPKIKYLHEKNVK